MSKGTPILVIDLECTCWVRLPPALKSPGEIIEIGLTPYYPHTQEVGDSRSIIVCPQETAVSDFCTQLTGLTQADVDAGIPLSEAFKILTQEYRAWRCVWASWGEWDRGKLLSETQHKGLHYPLSRQHLNIKALYAAAHKGWGCGLGRACKRLEIPFEGRPHSGVADSRMTAKILARILQWVAV